jgi:hypothetical protein
MPSTQFLAVVGLVLTSGARSWLPPIAFQGGGDACALLTTAQVTTALGTTVETGKPIVQSNPRICGWAPPGGPKIDGKKLTVSMLTTRGFELGKTPMEGIEKVPVTGVGDDALFITAGGLGTSLNVKKGGSGFTVRVGGFKKDQEMQIEKALALEILKKM